jgi:AhpD family alkylhydroperoxidase
MTPRLDFNKVDPSAFKAMLALQTYVNDSGLEHALVDLVKVRASQINGCAYCIDMHTQEARARGETEQRLYALDAWSETPFFSERERAALAWTEAVTRIGDGHVPQPVYDTACKSFDDASLVKLTIAVVAINGWNRLCIAFRAPAGTYKPAAKGH